MAASIPPSVPVIFLVLVALGCRQALTRSVRPTLLLAIALGMVGFALAGLVTAFGASGPALGAWLAGYALAVLGGTRLVTRSGMTSDGARVRVPGSWVPLLLMLGIFGVKFALGFAAAVHAAVLHEAWFVAATCAALGLCSGSFGARALAVQRVAAAAAARPAVATAG